MYLFFFFFNDTATTEIYTLSLHDALPIYDAGVFEFTFRDERFMPFEGAGAISVWELSLPENLRPFEYHTIADVILRIAYTAESDEALRSKVEQAQGTLAQYLSTAGITRVFSLRHEFADAWHKLVR